MLLRIGHSPDPDDAFLFYAMTQGKIPLDGIRVEHVMEGIEALNQRAFSGELEMTAISLAAYPYCADRYLLLTAGASIGEGYGPVVVARQAMTRQELGKVRVAIPGRFTTANLLLRLALGSLETEVLPFDQILPAVAEGRAAAGVLIHEGQLTYEASGLKKILDLGEWWRGETGLPVPLGVNVIRRDLGPENLRRAAGLFKESLEYAMAHRPEALAYAQAFARGLKPSLTDRFVGMYVNRLSVDCRPQGAEAMRILLDRAADAGLTPRRVAVEFV
jgi:1,4-dihydroxy-6-naphthoate synthase